MAAMAARVVPTIDGNPTYTEISLRWIDAVGDMRADVSKIDGAATNAQIETLISKTPALSQASLHTVRITQVYAGEMSKDNANLVLYASAQDNIVYHAKNAAHISRRAFAPAPAFYLFVADTETPDASQSSLAQWMAAWDVLWAGTFAGVSLRFTQRRDINKKVNL